MWGNGKRRSVLERPNGPSKRWARGGTAAARRAVRVCDLIRETPRALTVVIEPVDGKRLQFRAGQYLTHCFEIEGRSLRRAYSLCAAEGSRAAFTVQMVPGGEVSTWLNRHLQVGQAYSVLGPSGDFLLPDHDGSLGFVAGGSGITPVLGLIETALAQAPQRAIRLLYASRDQDSIIFRRRLEQLAALHPSLEVCHVLSQPGASWTGERGRLDTARIARHFAGWAADAEHYLCGPAGLMLAAEDALRGAGVDPSYIHRERFLAAPQPVQQRPTAPQALRFLRHDRHTLQQPGETILEAGLREGLPLPYSCTVGGCGHCKVRVVEGKVALNEPNCLTPEERAAGYTLACSAYALEPVVIDC